MHFDRMLSQSHNTLEKWHMSQGKFRGDHLRKTLSTPECPSNKNESRKLRNPRDSEWAEALRSLPKHLQRKAQKFNAKGPRHAHVRLVQCVYHFHRNRMHQRLRFHLCKN